MTYNPTDTDDDGTVDADVDNTNTTTQTLDTDTLSDGVAGAGNEIDAISGGSQTFRLVTVFPIVPGAELSTSSTTFDSLNQGSDVVLFDFDDLPQQQKNVESSLYVGINGRLEAPAGETATLRFAGEPDTERTATDGFNAVLANEPSNLSTTGEPGFKLEGKTTGGTANFDRLSVSVFERIQ